MPIGAIQLQMQLQGHIGKKRFPFFTVPCKDLAIATKFQSLSKSMFEVQKRFPMLKGKASEVKHFVPVALHMAEKLFTAPTEVETLMTGLLQQSALIDGIIDGSKEQFCLKGPQVAQLREAILQYNLLTSELRLRFGEKLLFNFTIKNHVLQHLAEDSQVLHPR
eukprot:5347603-Amphidinium_carterae.2